LTTIRLLVAMTVKSRRGVLVGATAGAWEDEQGPDPGTTQPWSHVGTILDGDPSSA
jgi:hypothetical protein